MAIAKRSKTLQESSAVRNSSAPVSRSHRAVAKHRHFARETDPARV
jgi:hypothetical protein